MGASNSYAIWPTVKSQCDRCQFPAEDCPKHNIPECSNAVTASLHVNVWKLTKNRFRDLYKFNWIGPAQSFVSLDVGVRLEAPALVEKINIFVPEVVLNKENVTDLSPYMKKIEMLSALFNDDVSIKQSFAQYQHKVTYDDREKSKEDFILYELTPDDIDIFTSKEGSLIQIATPYNGTSPLYVRVRLDEVALEFCSSSEELPNSILQSCFSRVDITNFQLNEFRTLHKRLRDKISNQGKFEFEKVNMFYVCNSDNDILVQSPNYNSCRYLETEIWKDYINNGFLESGNGNGVLAYHWKFAPKEGEKLKSFSVLVKRKLEGWNWTKIISRSLWLLLFGIVFGFSANFVYDYYKAYVASGYSQCQPEIPKGLLEELSNFCKRN